MKTFGAALALVAAVALAFPAAAADDIGVATAVRGVATLSRGAAGAHPVKFRDAVRWHDVIETSKDSGVRLLVLGKMSVTIRELSRVELREEAMAGGRRHTLGLLAGKVRAVVEHSLMDKNELVEVRSPNAVAAVRGTDFVVEVIPPPARAEAFGMLAATSGPMMAQGPSALITLVYTLAGAVDVTNGATERVAAFQGARVEGGAPPQRFTFSRVDLPSIIRGLTMPPPPPARTPPASPRAVEHVQQTALAQPIRGVGGTIGNPAVLRPTPRPGAGQQGETEIRAAGVGLPPGRPGEPGGFGAGVGRGGGLGLGAKPLVIPQIQASIISREVAARASQSATTDAVEVLKGARSVRNLDSFLDVVQQAGGNLGTVATQVSNGDIDRLNVSDDVKDRVRRKLGGARPPLR